MDGTILALNVVQGKTLIRASGSVVEAETVPPDDREPMICQHAMGTRAALLAVQSSR